MALIEDFGIAAVARRRRNFFPAANLYGIGPVLVFLAVGCLFLIICRIFLCHFLCP